MTLRNDEVLAAALLTDLRDDERREATAREERRAPAPVRYLEGLAVARGVDPPVARRIVRDVLVEYGRAPDTAESWVAILDAVLARSTVPDLLRPSA